jgi:hypothetical protein
MHPEFLMEQKLLLFLQLMKLELENKWEKIALDAIYTAKKIFEKRYFYVIVASFIS